jgi:hypothetical protein
MAGTQARPLQGLCRLAAAGAVPDVYFLERFVANRAQRPAARP